MLNTLLYNKSLQPAAAKGDMSICNSNIMYSELVLYPTSVSINYLYGFGSLLGLLLVNQLVTGMVLGCYYMPSIDFAFSSLDYMIRDVNYGWLISYMHSNGGSFFFMLIYMHIGSALYYGSYKKPSHKGWFSGMVLFLLVMGTAFLGYLLPWGLMSFWGGTVMTNFLSLMPYLGEPLAQWMWAGFVLGYPTMTSSFGLHFLIPFIISALSILHMLLLHMPSAGSSNPLLGADMMSAAMSFHPYLQLKDMLSGMFVTISFFFFLFYYPNYFSHTDNYMLANAFVTPEHMVPEWYFLPFYGMLSAIPNKVFGLMGMFSVFLMFVSLPFWSSSIPSTNLNSF